MSEKVEPTLAYPEQIHSILGDPVVNKMLHEDTPISGNELDDIQRRLESLDIVPAHEQIEHVLEQSTLQESSLIAQDIIDNVLTRVFEDEPDFEAINLERLTSFQGRLSPREIFSSSSGIPQVAFKYVEHEEEVRSPGLRGRFRRMLGRDTGQETERVVTQVNNEALIVVSLNNSSPEDTLAQERLRSQIRELSERFQSQNSLDRTDYTSDADEFPRITEMPGTADLARIRLLHAELSEIENKTKENNTVVVCLAKIDPVTKKPVRDPNGRMHAMATVMSENEYRQRLMNPSDPMSAVLRGESTAKEYKRRYEQQNRESYMSAWQTHDEAVLSWREVQEEEPETPTYEDPVELAMAKHDRKLRGEPEPPRPGPSEAEIHNAELDKWQRSRERLLDEIQARHIIGLEEVERRNEELIEETQSFVEDLNSKSREIDPNIHLGTEIEREIQAIMHNRPGLKREERDSIVARILTQYKYHKDEWGNYDKAEIYRSVNELERQQFLNRLSTLPAEDKKPYILDRRVGLFEQRISVKDIPNFEAGLSKIKTPEDVETFIESIRTDVTLMYDDESPEVVFKYFRFRAELALREYEEAEAERARQAAAAARATPRGPTRNNRSNGRHGTGTNGSTGTNGAATTATTGTNGANGANGAPAAPTSPRSAARRQRYRAPNNGSGGGNS